jgi:hypothetical protein
LSKGFGHYEQLHKGFADVDIFFLLLGFLFEDFEFGYFLFSVLLKFDNILNEHEMLQFRTFIAIF